MKEAFGHMHETMQRSRGLADRINCPHVEGEGDALDPGKY